VGDALTGIIRLHNTTTGKQVAEFKREGDGPVARLAFSPDGQSLAAVLNWVGEEGRLVVWDVKTVKERYRLPSLGFPGTCAFSPDGKRLATNQDRTGLTLWDLPGHRGLVPHLMRFTLDERRLIIPSPFRNRLIVVEDLFDAWPRSQRHGDDCWAPG
jgi:WD40 repeat protein